MDLNALLNDKSSPCSIVEIGPDLCPGHHWFLLDLTPDRGISYYGGGVGVTQIHEVVVRNFSTQSKYECAKVTFEPFGQGLNIRVTSLTRDHVVAHIDHRGLLNTLVVDHEISHLELFLRVSKEQMKDPGPRREEGSDK